MSISFTFYALRQTGDTNGLFRLPYDRFWNQYLHGIDDEEMLTLVQRFYAW